MAINVVKSPFTVEGNFVRESALRSIDGFIHKQLTENHCRLLLSEDFQSGFTWRGVTIVDPFAAQPSPLLEDLLGT